MNDRGSSVTSVAQVARPPAPSALSNALVFGWRAVLKFKHVPEQLFDLVMTPIMFTLLFTFVFGGALAGSPGDYLQYFLPGILVQTVVFNSVYSGMGLSTDLGKGLFDRFRSLPIWSLAPFAGLMVGDILRHLIAGMIILTIGLIFGFRPEAGVLGVAAAFLLLLAIGFGVGWIFIVLGLLIRTPMTVMTLGFTFMFPLVFASNIMVNPETMPNWLRIFVEVNPITHMASAMRALMGGAATAGAGAAGTGRAHRADRDARAPDALALQQALTARRRYSKNTGPSPMARNHLVMMILWPEVTGSPLCLVKVFGVPSALRLFHSSARPVFGSKVWPSSVKQVPPPLHAFVQVDHEGPGAIAARAGETDELLGAGLEVVPVRLELLADVVTLRLDAFANTPRGCRWSCRSSHRCSGPPGS